MNLMSLLGLDRVSPPSPGFSRISSSEAADIMASGKAHIVLDVRTADEYKAFHIPGAINIPNQLIGSRELSELGDKDNLILVHCLSGGRSRNAAAKLAAMGYRNVKDFGGINSWQGEIVSS